jgi:hypothetical protein
LHCVTSTRNKAFQDWLEAILLPTPSVAGDLERLKNDW